MKHSAGILAVRRRAGATEVLLVHPGGPFWRRRDLGAWSIPKGEIDLGEDPEAAARREFAEELGCSPSGSLMPLGTVRQNAGKSVTAFAMASDFDVTTLAGNLIDVEWPPRSGRMERFPEVDRAEWFSLSVAQSKLVAGQRPLLDRLEQLLADGSLVAKGDPPLDQAEPPDDGLAS